MTVGRLTSDPAEARTTFRDLRAASERLRGRRPDLGPALSMGMSDDFEVADRGGRDARPGRPGAVRGAAAHPRARGRTPHPEDAPARLIGLGW